MNFIKEYLKGIAIGSGAILPGISSGVLCVIFGIYDKLIKSVLGIFKDFKKNFFYLLPIALGGFTGILLFGNILKYLFSAFPLQTNYAFIGLILGSIPILVKKINKKDYFRLHYLLYTLLAFVIGLLSILLENYICTNFSPNLIANASALSSSSIILLIVAGFFMSIGIVVPGVSSTIILMCFGIYDIYLEAVASLNLAILFPLGIGVLIGGFLFLNIIKYLLDHFYMQTFYSIIGFTLGSILVLYMPITFDFYGLLAILLLITCFYIANFLESKE